MSKKKLPPQLNGYVTSSYKGIVVVFVCITLLLVSLIVYFSFSKTVISVTPQVRTLSHRFTWQVGDLGAEIENSEMFLSGKIIEEEVSSEKSYSHLGTHGEVADYATGEVTITNNYSSAQPLVATTRLLSDEGVLFRTQESVTVPAGSSVQVRVISDEKGAHTNIPASRFTIVALWEGLQDKIYATSSTPMTGGTKIVTHLSSVDLAEVEATFQDELFQETLSRLKIELQSENTSWSIHPDFTSMKLIHFTSSAEVGDEVSEINVNGTLQVSAVAFDQEKLWELAETKLKNHLSPTDKLLRIDRSQSDLKLIDIHPTNNTATIQMEPTGLVILKLSSSFLDPANFVNKDRHDITSYLLDSELVSQVDIHFSPFWTFRAPALEDHIEIHIESDGLTR